MKRFIKRSTVRFLIVGGANTITTYVIYWLLLHVLEYHAAYTASFALGLCLGYVLNSMWVFGESMSAGSAVAYPVAVLAQYAVSVGLLTVFVEWFGISRQLAPVLVIVIMFPIMYLVMRFIFSRSAASNG
ncbi:GtrA family protein [Paraburkholderia saeva]|uniref:GtrA family protein n=1 Tax=Paraburkholderia saeva TaxID=2777537 RepID=UPI001DF8A361|nr:GtrA family protein [Paraburkholderia saeva]CAG4906828.1 hypothetical protein R52603_03459 [Paraburkholderia saeva]